MRSPASPGHDCLPARSTLRALPRTLQLRWVAQLTPPVSVAGCASSAPRSTARCCQSARWEGAGLASSNAGNNLPPRGAARVAAAAGSVESRALSACRCACCAELLAIKCTERSAEESRGAGARATVPGNAPGLRRLQDERGPAPASQLAAALESKQA